MIGEDVIRIDSRAKLTGATRYAADIRYEGMLWGATVRAPLAHGRIKAIRRLEAPGVDWSRVVFATADDIVGKRNVQMISADMPFLAHDEVLYKGEPVALVAASTLQEAEAASRAVEVEMEPLPALFTLDELVALHQARSDQLHELSRWHVGHGDAAAALEGAEVVVEGCYTTPHQEQAYLETNAMTAIPEPDGCMRVEGSMQCPYYVAPAVAGMLGTDLDHLHVKALVMGGAFGGKEDYPSQLGGHVALLAQLSGKPTRIVLSRADDVAYTPKRHPAWVKIRAGARRDGTLCGVQIDVVFDGGAYVTMSPVVLSRGAIHAAGAYRWPAVQIDAVAYRSNTPPCGAFRGFGVPQVIFAIESHMDLLAAACELSPHAMRLKNHLRSGDLTATSQTLTESVGSREVLDAALEQSDFERKLSQTGWGQVKPGDRVARGVGLAFYWHGAGFTGAGEARIAAQVALDLADDGLAHVRVSSTEMGQGSHTVLPQIAAEALGVPLELVVCDPVDTRDVPNSGPTVASRTTMIVGGELEGCARDARLRLLAAVAAQRGVPPEALTIEGGEVRRGDEVLGGFSELIRQCLAEEGAQRWEFLRQHELASHLKWDEVTHTGDAYACYAWGCTIAEVEIDLDLLELRVPRVYVVSDIGRTVNPTLARGQVAGGTLQSLGYALCEEVGVRPDGALLRDRFQTYILPTSLDAPQIDVQLLEIPYSRGPGGAKGLGEMPMSGGGPAVANAVAHALGVRVADLPVSPERIFAALQRREGRSS